MPKESFFQLDCAQATDRIKKIFKRRGFAARVMKCPTCGKPVEWKDNQYRPFCSERCQLVDLGKWVEGEYRVPGESLPSEQTERRDEESEN